MSIASRARWVGAFAVVVGASAAACGSSDGGAGTSSLGGGGKGEGGASTTSGGHPSASGSGAHASSSSSAGTGNHAASTSSSGGGTAGPGGSGAGGGAAGPCPSGVTCVSTFPFHDERDTSLEGSTNLDTYACDPTADESGPEIVYRVDVPTAGFLSAAVYDGAAVDIDVHILKGADPLVATCLDRGDHDARADVDAGSYWVIADTFVSGGVPQSGPFQIDIGFIVPSQGPCDVKTGTLDRVNDGGNALQMPATGPIVEEAHLVTQAEPPPYPTSFTDKLDAHYALSQATTGLVMFRTQDWAPEEGGGTFFGEGVGNPANFPVEDEGWYVNMYWTSTSRPPPGTRLILRDPNGGPRAVVVAGGYETGPGDLTHVAGTPEETHFYMGTTHLDPMTVGFAVDGTLPLGPRVCSP